MKKRFGIYFFIVMLLVSCGGNGNANTTPAPYTEFEYDVKQTGTDVLQFAGQPFPITADNCGGLESSSQTTTRSQKFTTELNVEISSSLTTEFGGDAKVVKAVLGSEIATKLGVTLGVESQATSSLEITTPPGTKTTALLQWKAQWTKGDISIIRPDGTYIDILPFAVLNSLNLEQQEIKTIDCKTGEILSQSRLEESLPTEILMSNQSENGEETTIEKTVEPTPNINIDSTIYDNFDNPQFDGSMNLGLWDILQSEAKLVQNNGHLELSATPNDGDEGAILYLQNWGKPYFRFFEAKIMLSSERNEEFGDAIVMLNTYFDSTGYITYGLGHWGHSTSQPYIGVGSNPWGDRVIIDAQYDTWHTMRIEFDDEQKHFGYYVDDQLVTTIELPPEVSRNFTPGIQIWHNENAFIKVFIDDVRIGQ